MVGSIPNSDRLELATILLGLVERLGPEKVISELGVSPGGLAGLLLGDSDFSDEMSDRLRRIQDVLDYSAELSGRTLLIQDVLGEEATGHGVSLSGSALGLRSRRSGVGDDEVEALLSDRPAVSAVGPDGYGLGVLDDADVGRSLRRHRDLAVLFVALRAELSWWAARQVEAQERYDADRVEFFADRFLLGQVPEGLMPSLPEDLPDWRGYLACRGRLVAVAVELSSSAETLRRAGLGSLVPLLAAGTDGMLPLRRCRPVAPRVKRPVWWRRLLLPLLWRR